MSGKPLQALNSVQINAKSNGIIHTPAKAAVSKPEIHHHRRKQKLSSLCKTPPSVVRTRNGRGYHRGMFLGEGGFARCFQMKDESGKIYAAKTVAKASIKNEKTKTKLLSEIKIHKSMSHPNIVKFVDCFEDDVNVYILLEICPNHSLMDLLKSRKFVSEPEVRFFMTQIIGAVRYLHGRMVVHRDLKLGNVFFDPEMNLKIGDFGLATVLNPPYNKRYTICGTPNYIAPEVLGGKKTGHSYEVDIWAIGIMMYAMLFGKPPFQAKDVQVIYERIKRNEYRFPSDSSVSEQAVDLINMLLKHNPKSRPSLDDILQHPWFTSGPFPSRITTDSLKGTPSNFSMLTREESLINFENTKNHAGIGHDPTVPVEILTSDLHSERPKTLLPHSLSPDNNKSKYREIISPMGGNGNVNVKPYKSKLSSELNRVTYESKMVQLLNESLSRTLTNLKQIEDGTTANNVHNIDQVETPVLVSKWVDYSNKHGFAYQLTTGSIGVLFNSGYTVLKNPEYTKVCIIEPVVERGWDVHSMQPNDVPPFMERNVEIVDFFQKYMNAHLSDVANGADEDAPEAVFLRRYTRDDNYIMFEMSNGSYQFNFKDHHKYVLSQYGEYITHVSPAKKIETLPLEYVISQGNFLQYKDEYFDVKYEFLKHALREKIAM
ncbi:hypothetical protein FOA43_002728 [Brettanomyces nanus]|uniref:Serine/threonine-protein kinase n=1 Tax=Eeniella nana TaxID=13502 RepID=A0A875S4T2_EENNA|nr:uncharacterized protein FOA43_002728 [Brettanomyces nanus]QPG75375.1 hypothetical protein FOA43_002728 [Brettanomyces nanus]